MIFTVNNEINGINCDAMKINEIDSLDFVRNKSLLEVSQWYMPCQKYSGEFNQTRVTQSRK